MHDIMIHDLDDGVYEWIAACAKFNDRHIGDEARLILLENMGIDTSTERAGDKPGQPRRVYAPQR